MSLQFGGSFRTLAMVAHCRPRTRDTKAWGIVIPLGYNSKSRLKTKQLDMPIIPASAECRGRRAAVSLRPAWYIEQVPE